MSTAVFPELAEFDRMIVRGASYDEMKSWIDEARTQLASEFQPAVARNWVTACALHERPEIDCRAAVTLMLSEVSDLVVRTMSALAVCRRHPGLARDVLPALIDELERTENVEPNALRHARGALAAAELPPSKVADLLLLAAEAGPRRVMLESLLAGGNLDTERTLRVRRCIEERSTSDE